jgi:hypothetical protein
MFCPQCATKNLDGASFCRTCGANISLVPQALTGQIPTQPEIEEQPLSRRGRRRSRHDRDVGLDQVFRNIFMGIAFLIVAVALSQSIGRGWWFWMLFPAFSMMGTGVAQYIRFKEREKRAAILMPPAQRTFQDRPNPVDARPLSAPQTGELMPPVPSVTEGTTRHLGAEAPTRHLDASNDQN